MLMFVPQPLADGCSFLTIYEALERLASREASPCAESVPTPASISAPTPESIDLPVGSQAWWAEWWKQAKLSGDPAGLAEAKRLERLLFHALAAGSLTAFVLPPKDNILYRVDREYWIEDWWLFRSSERLLEGDQSVPPHLRGLPILIDEVEFKKFINLLDGVVMEPLGIQAARRTPVDREEFRQWMASRIEAGEGQTVIVASAKKAFPQQDIPSREDRRAIHRKEHRRIKGKDPTPGSDPQ